MCKYQCSAFLLHFHLSLFYANGILFSVFRWHEDNSSFLIWLWIVSCKQKLLVRENKEKRKFSSSLGLWFANYSWDDCARIWSFMSGKVENKSPNQLKWVTAQWINLRIYKFSANLHIIRWLLRVKSWIAILSTEFPDLAI